MHAAYIGQKERVRQLLEAGADPGIKDHDGKAALDYAIEKDRKEVALLLKDLEKK